MQRTTKSRHRNTRAINYPALVRLAIFIFILTLTIPSRAQWEIEDSHTNASLRGIDSVGGGVAWASGTNGTILRTEDSGGHWQTCTTPPGADKLDFRGIQAFDANTAIAMSSGKGDLSRLYKTTDGCQTWKLIFTNTDKDGFWDAIKFSDPNHGFLLGDPVPVAGSKKKRLTFKQTIDGGKTWISWEQKVSELSLDDSVDNVSVFAASNSSLIALDRFNAVLATGGKSGSMLVFPSNHGVGFCGCSKALTDQKLNNKLDIWLVKDAPFPQTETGGIFSIANDNEKEKIVAVGGDYKLPDSPMQTAGYGSHLLNVGFKAAETPPHGFRSAVAYDAQQKLWITVGPNGTDISRDDGRNWTPLKPTKEDAPDADKNWNALSLPFVVGPNGRIGKLRPTALNP